MNLRQALRLSPNSRVALVGSGGKTTAMFQAARQLDPPVVVTASTHLGEWQLEFADRHFFITRVEDVDRYAGQIEGVTLFSGTPVKDKRVLGLAEDALGRIYQLSSPLGFPVLVEADGSRQKPLKAPGEKEPVIPGWVNHVVLCAGLWGVGKPLTPEVVHRAELFSSLSQIPLNAPITLDGLFRVLLHPQGGMKNIPVAAKRSLILNLPFLDQADDKQLSSLIFRVANYTTNPLNSIIISTLKEKRIIASIEPTAGVLLAAGGAQRFGSPKLLAEWRGKPLIRHVAETAISAGLDWVGIVVGAAEEQIRAVVADLPIQIINNPDWQQGQSTSIRAGVQAVPEHTGAVVFLLGDQPEISGKLVSALIDQHRHTQAKIITPTVQGRRGNPVLFDRATFPDLSQIVGDTGGRAIFSKYPVETLEWDDPAILIDIDTPGDLGTLQRKG